MESLFRMRISNPFQGSLVLDDGKLQTSKLEAGLHGQGMAIIRETMQKYGGEAAWSEEDGVFHLKLLLPIRTETPLGKS